MTLRTGTPHGAQLPHGRPSASPGTPHAKGAERDPADALVAELRAEGIYAVTDGYSVTECSYRLGPDHCGLQVVRPGRVQCWCDHECPGVGFIHEQGLCASAHRAPRDTDSTIEEGRTQR